MVIKRVSSQDVKSEVLCTLIERTDGRPYVYNSADVKTLSMKDSESSGFGWGNVADYCLETSAGMISVRLGIAALRIATCLQILYQLRRNPPWLQL